MKLKHTSIVILLICAAVITIALYNTLRPGIELETDSAIYLHYNYVKIFAHPKSIRIRNSLKTHQIRAFVYREDIIVPTIGYREYILLQYDSSNRCWTGKWPVPWNAPEGEYQVRLSSIPLPGLKSVSVSKSAFRIERRQPSGVETPMSILTMEYSKSFKKMKVRGPDGVYGSWKKLFDWADFAGADTFLHLAGQTSAYLEKIDQTFPWNKDNLRLLPEIAKEAHKHNLKFGAWVAAYLTFGPRRLAADYEYALDYNSKKRELFRGRGISLADKNRVDDIIEFINGIKTIKEIDYIGLDYIRNAKGGFEMVDEFVHDMSIALPAGWNGFPGWKRMM